jgi:hypothetical protein
VSEKRRRQTGAALAISAALHLLVALLVLRNVTGRRPAEPPAARPPTPIELSIVETAAQPRPEVGQADVSRPTVRRRAPGKRPVEAGGIATPPAPPLPAKPAAPPEKPVDLSFEALADGAKQRATATPGGDDALERLLAPPPEGPALPTRRKPIAELRAESDRRAAAVANVRAGRADPLLFDLLRNARERLTPGATHIAESLPLGVAETTKGWGRGYLRRVAEAHSGQLDPSPAPQDPVGGPRPDVLGAYDEATRQSESGAEQRTAEVCLGVAPSHDVVVTLRRSSGNAELDRLAVDSFRSAGGARPVTSGVRPALACYRVAVSAFRLPPLPTVGLDLINRRILYPLKRITKVTVELQSVDFGERHEPPSFLDARSR